MKKLVLKTTRRWGGRSPTICVGGFLYNFERKPKVCEQHSRQGQLLADTAKTDDHFLASRNTVLK